MYLISKLAKEAQLSRSTILYYEKLGLISGKRMENGYRFYSEIDLQKLHLIQKLQAGGLTLKEIMICLESKMDRAVLQNRLIQLDREIEEKRKARDVLAALLGEGDLSEWQRSLDRLAPKAHLEWLLKQGFDEKNAYRLRWLTKNMNEHDAYMSDFFTVYETLKYWGPGSEEDTNSVLQKLEVPPKNILEIGCGKGVATEVLARNSSATITAVDNEESALESLNRDLKEKGLENRVKTLCASMTELPFSKEEFDVIWCETSIYIMGFEEALRYWRDFLKKSGFMVVNDLVWSNDSPHPECREFWEKEYPDIGKAERRIQQAQKLGYRFLFDQPLSWQGWLNYYEPLKERLEFLKPTLGERTAWQDLNREVDIIFQYPKDINYNFFVLEKK